MRAFIYGLLIFVFLAGAVAAQDDERYIINPDENTISILDPDSGETVATIEVGPEPTNLAILPDSNRLYVANRGDNTISVIDTDTFEVVTTLELPATPLSMVADSRANRVYVAHEEDTTIIAGDSLLTPPPALPVNRPPRSPQRDFTTLPPLTIPVGRAPLMLPASPLCLQARDTFLTNLPPDLIDIQCRVLAESGEFIQNPGEIGVDTVLEMGVIHAVDIFSPSDAAINNIIVCIQGSGGIIFLDAEDWPREPRVLLASETQGYTCTLLPDLGTLILVD